MHIDANDPRYAEAAAEILRRHQRYEPEANITSAIRNFLTLTKLAKENDIIEENPPSDLSRRAVDITTLDTFIEIKRRIGTASGNTPDPDNIKQIDEYLAESQKRGKGVRMGVLTDGKHWILRWQDASATVNTNYPYMFTLESEQSWFPLYEWLRDKVLISHISLSPHRNNIENHFGPASPSYQRDIDSLKSLYNQYASYDSIKLKRSLWQNLLIAALGQIAITDEQMNDLFIRHTYISSVVGMVVQASFGIDINQLAESDPEDLLSGAEFRNATGLQGVVESDFFAWPNEVGGSDLMRAIARRVIRFNWAEASPDVAAMLYEAVIPPAERRQLGEYYTPEWLAHSIVRNTIKDPINQRVLDPACGSGAFLTQAITHFIQSAEKENVSKTEIFTKLRDAVTGIDVHPVAVHLARSAWVLAAKKAITASTISTVTIPVYLGDSLQLRYRTGDLFANHILTIEVQDEENSRLEFPRTVVNRAETFDALMTGIVEHIENNDAPTLALDENLINDPEERRILQSTIETLQRLHQHGRNHIWAYYTRNLVRPVVLSDEKVDIIVGNPPWINYNQTSSILRAELENQSKNTYGIWTGGRYATHQDVAGLFFTRCIDLYLKDGGTIGMVMPHSALQAGHYSKWRTGCWQSKSNGKTISVDFQHIKAWDLEKLEPNTFFPIPASVVFAKMVNAEEVAPLAGEIERWLGETDSDEVERVPVTITDTSEKNESYYAQHTRNGAILTPRCLFFVNEVESQVIIPARNTITVYPRRGSQDKSPWRDLSLPNISNKTIENDHVFNVHLGETLAPYITLEPLKAVLPFKHGDKEISTDQSGEAGIDISSIKRLMRNRWRAISRIWEENKRPANKLNLLQQIDYYGKLSRQLAWMDAPGDRPIRVVYASSGIPTAAILHEADTIVDNTLFSVSCESLQEAYYLLGIINSNTLYKELAPMMPKGQYGPRHVQKHLWQLPIPEFNPSNKLHISISEAGQAAAAGVAEQLNKLHQERDQVTVAIARRELRKWLLESDEGKAVEQTVAKLLLR